MGESVRTRTADAALRIGHGEIRLWSLPFTIGRSSGNTLTLRNQLISRTHCQIDRVDGVYQITSLAEKRPVVVNGSPILCHRLHDGDEIEIHEHRFVFALIGDDADAGTAAAFPSHDDTARPEPERAPLPADPAPPAVAAAASMAQAPAAAVAPTRAWAAPPRASGGVIVIGMLGCVLMVGVLGLGALSLHQSRQQALARRLALVQLHDELDALAQTAETARQQGALDRESTLRAWQLLFEEQKAQADAADAARKVARHRQTARPVDRTPPVRLDPPVAQPDPPVAKPDPPVAKPDPPVATPDPPLVKPEVAPPDPPPAVKPDTPVAPPTAAGVPFFHHKIGPKRIAFVVDKSGAMQKDLPRVMEQLKLAVDAMGAEHQFTMAFFDANSRVFSRNLVVADDRHKGLAKRFIRTQRPEGTAVAGPVLKDALDIKEAPVEALVFVTAGAISDAELDWLEGLLKQIVAGKLGRPLLVYIWSANPTPRIDKLLKLASQQRYS